MAGMTGIVLLAHGSRDVRWRANAPEGKLDLLLSLDFRMTSTTLFSDVVLPAATWYEKHDLSSTDMHPFVHAFSPAIAPPWQTRTDFAAFHALARTFSTLAATHLGVRRDIVAVPLTHDTPDELSSPQGTVTDTRPRLVVVERDYGTIADQLGALGPALDRLGTVTKGVHVDVGPEVDFLRKANGEVHGGVADGRPRLDRDTHMCEAILTLSGTTNGRVAVEGFQALERRTGQRLADLAAEHAGKHIRFADTQSRPVPLWTRLEIEVLLPRGHDAERVAAHVTRRTRDGGGIEWCEVAPQSVLVLLGVGDTHRTTISHG